jgi:hypothetical protein
MVLLRARDLLTSLLNMAPPPRQRSVAGRLKHRAARLRQLPGDLAWRHRR